MKTQLTVYIEVLITEMNSSLLESLKITPHDSTGTHYMHASKHTKVYTVPK